MIFSTKAPVSSLVATLLVGALLSFGPAYGQDPAASGSDWELRVCADPHGYPISSQNLDGYENRIAEILADELGAKLTYEWTLISDATVQLLLKRGACDVVLSAGEGAMGLLNTVAYQRIPNVFLYLKDSGFAAETLFDPSLKDYSIGTMPNTSMQAVLFDLGLAENYVGIQPNAAKRGFERIRPTVDALLADDIDVAIVSGALASEYVRRQPDTFAMTAVQPELVPPLTPTFYMATMGVRPYDEGLRDALNLVLARRWDDVQQVFAEVGVPLLHSPAILAAERPPGTLRIGVIAPFPTGFAAEMDVLAESAYFGARIADDLGLRRQDRAGLDLHLVYASAPSTEAALRAYDRLVAFDGVAAVVVVHDASTTSSLAQRAAETEVPILNALAGEPQLRSSACYANTFHIAPSDGAYTLALAEQVVRQGIGSATIVSDGSKEVAYLSSLLMRALDERDVSSSVVEVAGGLVFSMQDVTAASEAGTEAVIVMLPQDAQGMYLGELMREDYEGLILGFPWPEMQTRQFYYRLKQDSPTALAAPRVAGWDASLSADGADQLNLRYASRSALAMDVTAWTTYAAVELAIQAYVDSSNGDKSMAEAIKGAPVAASLHKEAALAFDDEANQLLQPLYLVQVDQEGRWSSAVSERVSLASVVDSIPMDLLGSAEGPRDGCD